MSVLVPPMSKVTTFLRPVARASAAPATTPAAGPEISVWLGKRAPIVMRIRPPFDCIRNICGVVMPQSRSRRSRFDEVALDDRPDIGVDHRGRQARILADNRQHARRQRDAPGRLLLGENLGGAFLVRGIAETEQVADRDGLARPWP